MSETSPLLLSGYSSHSSAPLASSCSWQQGAWVLHPQAQGGCTPSTGAFIHPQQPLPSLEPASQRFRHCASIYALALMANNLLDPRAPPSPGWDQQQAWVCGGSIGVMAWAARSAPVAVCRAVWPGSIGPHVSNSCWSLGRRGRWSLQSQWDSRECMV